MFGCCYDAREQVKKKLTFKDSYFQKRKNEQLTYLSALDKVLFQRTCQLTWTSLELAQLTVCALKKVIPKLSDTIACVFFSAN